MASRAALTQITSSFLLLGRLDRMDTTMFVLWASSWVFARLPSTFSRSASVIGVIVWRYLVLLCMETTWLIGETCRCGFPCMAGCWVGSHMFGSIFRGSFTR